jgi:A/G-specific adenine glycosylase
VHEALLSWAAERGRDLPWRGTRDPWAVLVSEAMLQQTQVARVVPRYRAFMKRFPTPAACAAAPVADVVRAWAGLGYNRRAVNLHGAAVVAVARHGGALPGDLDALLALPGVGPYTARAVLAFAFAADVGVLDVNGQRVLSRLIGRPVAQPDADALVPPSRGWAWNQAVLDVGATVCRPRPRCDGCPLSPHCAWLAGGLAEPDPWRRGPRQSTFAGSDRQGRGRLVDALRAGPVTRADLAATAGWPGERERAERVAQTLVADGLAVAGPDGDLELPR